MGDKPNIAPTGGLDRSPKMGGLVHGGFRSNRHHEAIEELADERDMGRDILRQTDGGYPESMMSEGHAGMMRAWGSRGEGENVKSSKWSKGK